MTDNVVPLGHHSRRLRVLCAQCRVRATLASAMAESAWPLKNIPILFRNLLRSADIARDTATSIESDMETPQVPKSARSQPQQRSETVGCCPTYFELIFGIENTGCFSVHGAADHQQVYGERVADAIKTVRPPRSNVVGFLVVKALLSIEACKTGDHILERHHVLIPLPISIITPVRADDSGDACLEILFPLSNPVVEIDGTEANKTSLYIDQTSNRWRQVQEWGLRWQR